MRPLAAHKASGSHDDQGQSPVASSLYAENSGSKRVSVWINGLIFDQNPLPLGFRRQTWCDPECTLFLDEQPYYLLQKWIDQREHPNELRRQVIDHTLGGDTQAWQAALCERKGEKRTLKEVKAADRLIDCTANPDGHKQPGLSTSSGSPASRPTVSVHPSSGLGPEGGTCFAGCSLQRSIF